MSVTISRSIDTIESNCVPYRTRVRKERDQICVAFHSEA